MYYHSGLVYRSFCSYQTIQWLKHLLLVDCKTAPSFTRSPKIGDFERDLAHASEMGERGEGGVARPGKKGNGERGAYIPASLIEVEIACTFESTYYILVQNLRA